MFCHFSDGADSVLTVGHAFSMEDTVEDWLVNLEKHGSELPEYQHAAGLLIVRLVVFIGLLSSGKDFVTPIVLAKDRAKYEASTDDQVKRWIEERAVRRAGKGFDVGKQLQLVHDSSPHWRNPHLCLFWTGEGRSKPIIKMRSGTIIQSVSMAEVPTGYLGPETSEDDRIEIGSTPRETISKRRRFKIMQRDGFRCQLCGASSDGGFTLHVDHKVPLAKGGSNEEDNLWTLCKPCNLGKSDSLL
ncbi:MAG: HNH endonuclease [Planctomycetaceae bacterium]